MNAVLKLIIVGLAVAVAWWILHPRPVFVVLIRKGAARMSKGKVARAFLAEINDECRRSGLTKGVIRGVRKKGRLSLAFSRRIPEDSRQRLRNAWQLTG